MRLRIISIFTLVLLQLSLIAQDEALLLEVEQGSLGSDFQTLQDDNITYVTPETDFASTSNPGNDSKVITLSVPFTETGSYDLYARIRVGADSYGDDSFYIGNGFGSKTSDNDSDWHTINGIVPVGYNGSQDIVDGQGSIGSLTWKWINISEFLGGDTPVVFDVESTESAVIFQLGAREDGLDFDKIAFGKSDLYYTVQNLENGEAGSEILPEDDAYPEGAYQTVKTYLNPVLPGDHPDLTLLKVGNDFYTCNSSFHFTPYLAISHSTDLVHWKEISRVVAPDWSGLINTAPKQGIWQGAITYFYDSYWIYFSNTAGGGQYFSKAETPLGPWSDPEKMNTTNDTGASGYDNSVFVDDDGTPYLHIKPGRNTNRIQEIGTDGHLTGSVINLDWVNAENQYSWAEGPVMCKRDGWYYYFIAGNVGGGQYVLRSPSLTGDENSWEELGDFFEPITDPSTPFRGPNHMSQPFQMEDGTWWTMAHSYENLSGDSWGGKGRQGLLHQVIWDMDGKPTGVAPTTSPLVSPDLPKSGISWKLPRSDYFDDGLLGVFWHFLGPEEASRYSLTEQPGWLRINPGSGRSHVLQKDAGRYYSLVTRVHIDATSDEQGAGLYLTNGNESVNIRLYSGYSNGKKIFFSFDAISYSADNAIGNTLWLKLERNQHELSGYYSGDGLTWTQVGETISAVDLDKNQENDNWWVGNSQGLFAEGTKADFDLYFYRDGASELALAGSENHFGVDQSNTSAGVAFSNATDNGGWLMLGGVELGKDASRVSKKIEVMVASQTSGSLEVWLDDLENEGKLIATIPVTSTGSTDTWQKFSANITNVTGGQHDVYLRFVGSANAFSIRSIRFLADVNVVPYVEETAPLGLNENDWLRVYPNPFEHGLMVDLGNRSAEYAIYDLSGKQVEKGMIDSSGQKIGRGLNPAIYQLVVTTSDGYKTTKIIKSGL